MGHYLHYLHAGVFFHVAVRQISIEYRFKERFDEIINFKLHFCLELNYQIKKIK